ncbi:MAG TPA: class I SAM-dependent methyltransferase [Trebonia sp.]|jgi:SAM-dependent methyltransferase
MTADAYADTYAMGHTPDERRRLSLQDRVFAPHTENLFRQAGIATGHRVIDAGCGTGDTTRLLARMVGPEGTVIGVDQDPSSLETARASAAAEGLANVRFVQADVRETTPGEPVDVLAGRALLMHQRGPGRTLAHMAQWVRPGGIIAFQDFAMGRAGSLPEVPLMSRWVRWVSAALRQAGGDPEFGDSMPALFRDAGLTDPGFAAVRIAGDADSLLPEYLTQTARSLSPLIVAAGAATAAEIARDSAQALAAQARERQAMLFSQDLVSVWARL